MQRRRQIAIAAAAVVVGGALLALWSAHRARTRTATNTAGSHAASSAIHRMPDPRTQPRTSIAGAVRDDAGAPIAGAYVCADLASTVVPRALRAPRCTTTAADGTYTLGDLLAGTYGVTAATHGRIPARFRPSPSDDELVLPAGERRTAVDFVLRAGGERVAGTVLDATGKPIAHARVRAVDHLLGKLPPVECDDAGHYELWAARHALRMCAHADGFTRVCATGDAPGTIDIVLEPAATLAGSVVDATTHQPVGGIRVGVTADPRDPWVDEDTGDLTDDRGRFEIADLAPGRYAVLAHDVDRYGRSGGSIAVGLGQRVDDVVVQVHPAPTVEGHVMIAGTPGRPCPRATLTAEAWDASEAGLRDQIWRVRPGATLHGRVTITDGAPVEGARVSVAGLVAYTQRDGTYAFTGVPAGKWLIEVESDAGVPIVPLDGIEIAAGEAATRDLVLTRTATVEGMVVDRGGKGVADATVWLLGPAGTWEDGSTRALTRSDGTFVERGVVPGAYVLDAMLDPRSHAVEARAPVTAALPRTAGIRLVLDAGAGVISGDVADADGQPVRGAYVVADRERTLISDDEPHGDQHRTMTTSDGTFRITGLRNSTYVMRAYRHGGGEAITEHVAVGASVHLQIQRTATVTGTVRGAGRVLTVVARGTASKVSRSEQYFATGGAYTVRDLPPGTYRIAATSGARTTASTIELQAGGTATLYLDLAATVHVTGQLVDDRTGVPIPEYPLGVSVFEQPPTNPPHRFTTDAQGRFAVDVTRGDVIVFGTKQGYGRVLVRRDTGSAPSLDLGVIRVLPTHVSERSYGELQAQASGTELGDGCKIIIDHIERGGAADKAGLVNGDTITAIDGHDLRTLECEVALTLLEWPAGTVVRVETPRTGATSVTLAPQP